MTPGADDPLTPDTRIEVRNRLDGRWSRGFEIVTIEPDGYRVRRMSDGRVLPALFGPDDIRRPKDRRRDTWWY
jgi:hypothetical protein